MFRNIGGKIKVLAKVLCWLGIILSVIIAVLEIVTGTIAICTDVEATPDIGYTDFAVDTGSVWSGTGTDYTNVSTNTSGLGAYMILSGILLLVFGPLFSWIGSFLLYGYGDLIANTAEIAQQIKTVPIPAAPPVELLAGSSNREADKPSPETESEPQEDL